MRCSGDRDPALPLSPSQSDSPNPAHPRDCSRRESDNARVTPAATPGPAIVATQTPIINPETPRPAGVFTFKTPYGLSHQRAATAGAQPLRRLMSLLTPLSTRKASSSTPTELKRHIVAIEMRLPRIFSASDQTT